MHMYNEIRLDHIGPITYNESTCSEKLSCCERSWRWVCGEEELDESHMISSRRAASVIPIVLIDTTRGIRTLNFILTNLPPRITYGSRSATLALPLPSTCIKDAFH